MSFSVYLNEMRPAVEQDLMSFVKNSVQDEFRDFRSMLSYHMGWEGEGAGPEAQGKRIRPILLLLCAHAAGGNWHNALPAASAVELIHNFSLIHDDIQDQSELRRGRTTVWTKWGMAQGINAGDLMFTIAQICMFRLADHTNTAVALEAAHLLNQTCVSLTQGQFLDIGNEKEKRLALDAYWMMVGGKTAALLAGSAEIGALVAGVNKNQRLAYRKFGWSLGLAFQALDDWLGIWGDAALIGKSTDSDLVSGKKSLPVVYALAQDKEFSKRWSAGPITANEVPALAELLIQEGAQDFTRKKADELTQDAQVALHETGGSSEGIEALSELAELLLMRNK